MMKLNDFQQAVTRTAVYPQVGTGSRDAINYCIVGLCGEAGEAANKWKKVLRGDDEPDVRAGLISELQDCLWYLAQAMTEMDLEMEIEAQNLLDRLARRKAAGTLKGSGDQR